MTEELKQQARTALLSEGTGDQARTSRTTTVTVDEHDVEVEVRALPLSTYESTRIPPVIRTEDGGVETKYEDMQLSTIRQVALICECTYIPGTSERIFDEPGDVRQLLDAPFHQRSWLNQLAELVDYVHGRRTDPPEGIQDPLLGEIEESARDMQRQAESADDLSAQNVATIAERIANLAGRMHRGDDAGKTPTRSMD